MTQVVDILQLVTDRLQRISTLLVNSHLVDGEHILSAVNELIAVFK